MSSLQVYVSRGNQYARIVESYRDPITKKPKTKILKNLGRVDMLEKNEPGIIERLKKECVESKELNKQLKEAAIQKEVEQLLKGKDGTEESAGFPVQNYGVRIYQKIWEEMRLDQFFAYRQKKDSKISYDLGSVVKMLVLSRLMAPASKKRSYERKDQFIGQGEMEIEQVYRCLPFLAKEKENLEVYLNQQLSRKMDRSLSVAFYDVTTYYFESVAADDLAKFGYSKDNKVNQVQVVMGLLIDQAGIPISYSLFPGNTSDFKTLIPVMKDLKKRYGITKMILTADRGLNSGENLAFLKNEGFDYVVGFKVRSATQSIRQQILDEREYVPVGDDFRWKFLAYAKNDKGTHFDDRILVTWSAKRAAKDRTDRERLIQKSLRLVESKSRLEAEMKKGGKKYVQLSLLDDPVAVFDQKKVEMDEMFDGYYGIQTSDNSLSHEQILDLYGGLWKIEESFRVLKTDLEARPIFVKKPTSVQGHFVICYLALVIQRYLEYLLSERGLSVSTEKIQDALRSANVTTLPDLGKNRKAVYIKNQSNEDFSSIIKALSISEIPTFGTIGDIMRW